MSSAEIEAAIKKVLHISETKVLQNSTKAFDTDTAQQECRMADGFTECRENTSDFTQQMLNSSKMDVKNSNQFHAVGYGRGRGCRPSDAVDGAGSADVSSPKRRNRRKKKPGAVDDGQEFPPGTVPDSNEGGRLHQGVSEARVSSSANQPNRKQTTANSFQNKKKEFPFRVSSSAGRENTKPVGNPTGGNVWPSRRQYATSTGTATAGLAGMGGVKPAVVEASVTVVAQAETGGVKPRLETSAAVSVASVAQPCVTGPGFHAPANTQASGYVKKPVDKVSEGGVGGAKVSAAVAKSLRPAAESDVKTVATKAMESSAPRRQSFEASAAPNSNESIERELEKSYLFPLKKKNPRFPNAKFFCRLCEYHCDNFSHCQRHIKDTRHERLMSVLLEENLLKNMPLPSVQHCQAVTRAIYEVVAKVGMTASERDARLAIFSKIREITKSLSGGASTAVYGSTVSQSALKDSDLNIDVTDACPAKLLKNLYQVLKDDRSGEFRDVKSDFQSKVPAVYVTVPSINLTVQIGVNTGCSVQTSNLLAVYNQLDDRVQPLTIAFKYWARMCRIDRQIEGTLPAYVFGLMTVYFLQQCEPPVLPVLHELLTEEERKLPDGTEYLADRAKVEARWKTSNNSDVGRLWIELLRFYCLDLNTTDAVVCIRESNLVKRSEKKWTSKKLAIEDPFSRRRNVARSLSHSQIYEYIDERLRCAYKFFGIEPNGELEFSFNDPVLIPKKGPAIICGICQREGHLKSNCPEETLPPLPRLPPLNRRYINILNKVLHQVFEDFRPREREQKQRMNLLGELQSIVQNTYPGAKLRLFGSSCNGFGFQYSDLDISLTFADHETAENLNCVEIIETLAKKLKRHHGYYNVFAITTAKVPIIKFKHTRSQLEGDISLYNTLAQHNTRMLQTYVDVDPRVKILGYTMKVLAKSCEICDASRGSLSSYAYTLMVIFYLQQRKPPVIPVLQELYRGKKPETPVDGWNAWFYEDLNSLPRVWNACGKNQESITELWIGLLRFYTEEFNIKEYVVSIRQKEPLTKFEKLWNGCGIAIEDPFNLDHNLGSALSRKMNLYIIKVLRNARKIHGTPIDELNPRYMTMADYLFDQMILTDSPPPNDRGCRRCGKIGHFVNECPLLRKGKPLGVPDLEDEDDDDERQGKNAARSIPVLTTRKGASEPIKIPASDASRKPSRQGGSSASPDLSGSHSSVCSDASNHSTSDNHRATGGANDHPADDTTHDSLGGGPLVFHNSKISLLDATTTPAANTSSTGLASSAEVLLASSQIYGNSSYLVPAVLPSGFPIYPPGGLPASGSLSAPWLAANSSAANQIPLQMPVSATNPATSAISAGNMASSSSMGFVPSLMTLPYYGYPLLPGATASGNQLATAQGNFNAMIEGNSSASQLLKGQLSHQSQGQRAGQAIGPAVQQPTQPGLQGGQATHGHIPGFFQGQQGLGKAAQVHQAPGQSMNKGQAQGQQLQGQIQGQHQGQQQQQWPGQVHGQFQQGQHLQSQAHFKTPSQTDPKASLPEERKGIGGGSESRKNSESDQSSSPASAAAAMNQLPNFLPFAAINHPSVFPTSPFTMYMAQQFQQQQQYQQYQQLLQASLYQVLGLPNAGPPLPNTGGGGGGAHPQPGRSAPANPYASLMPLGSQLPGWPGNGGGTGPAGAPGVRLDGGLSSLSSASFGVKPTETVSSPILPGTAKESSAAQDLKNSAWQQQQQVPDEDGSN